MGAKFPPLFSAAIPTHSMLVKLVLWSKQNKIRPAALFEMIRPKQHLWPKILILMRERAVAP